MAEQHLKNGVNVQQMEETVATLKEQPPLAKFKFRARNRWLGGSRNRTTISKFYGAGQDQDSKNRPFVLDNGEHQVLLGDDHAPNPVEYVLHGLAGCLTTSLVYHAAARGIELDHVESTLEGDLDLQGFLGLDKDIRNGYQRIRVKFRIKGNATQDQLDELCQLAQDRSPVFDIVTNGVPVLVEMESTERTKTTYLSRVR